MNPFVIGFIEDAMKRGEDINKYKAPGGVTFLPYEKMVAIQLGLDPKKDYSYTQLAKIQDALKTGLPKEIVTQEIANPDFSAEEMAERREKLDEELYKLGKEGLLEKYGIVPEKENSEVEKDENTLDTSEEMLY